MAGFSGIGAEFRLNTTTDGFQSEISIARLADDTLVAVWTDGALDGDLNGVVLQRFAADGTPIGPETVVNSTTASVQGNPAVAALDTGGYVVVWQSLTGETQPFASRAGIFGQLYDASGAVLRSEFEVNEVGGGNQHFAAVTGLPGGRFAVAFASDGISTDQYEIAARVFAADGTPATAETQVNAATPGYQQPPEIATLKNGNLAVIWQDYGLGGPGQDGDGSGTFLRILDDSLTPVTGDIQVNQTTADDQIPGDIAVLADGTIVVVWQEGPRGSGDRLVARLLSDTGVPLSDEIAVNAGDDGNTVSPRVIATADGGFAVVWHGYDRLGDQGNIRGRLFDANGVPLGGSDVLLNTTTDDLQGQPAAAVAPDGSFTVAWTSWNQDGDSAGVYAQMFDAIVTDLRLEGTPDPDTLAGGAGDDTILGEAAADDLQGASGDDFLYGDGFHPGYSGENARAVYRLYQATLDRLPDGGGLRDWTARLDEGARTLAEIASGFVGSPEFTAVYGALDDTGFVTLLYENVLERAPDAAGLTNWTDKLATGTSRESVVLGFSESAEFRANTNAAAQAFAEQFTPALWADDVFRLYQATLDRAPDLGGFLNWTTQLGNGRDFLSVVTGFVGSAEFAAVYGALDDGAFVTLLYENVLGRSPDAAGLADWTGRLATGTTREEVVQGFAQSPEFVAGTKAALKIWVRDQGINDVLEGGAGSNVLMGGLLADRFVFDQTEDGTHTVRDLEGWDWLVFENFGYADVAAARSHMTQDGADVVFADQGVTVVLENTTLAAITDDMIVV